MRNTPSACASSKWRGLLRLVGVGTVRVKNNMSKEEVATELRRILGPCAPRKFSGFRTNFDAFAWVLTSYTGKAVSEETALRCVTNRRNRGYEYTETFYEVLGGRAWPPAFTGGAVISTPPSAFRSAREVSSWADVSPELTF